MEGVKRKSWDDTSAETPPLKKQHSAKTVEARVDPTYGQRSAIPGLDDDTSFGDEDELDYSEDMNALEYLRSVRQEAGGIPNLLVAPRTSPSTADRSIYEDGVGDFRGRYEDGAYLADADQLSNENEENDNVYQTTYFKSILARHAKLRLQLQQTPPAEDVARLGKNHPTHMPSFIRQHFRWWRHHVETSEPRPAQVASMDKGTVLQLIQILTMDRALKRGNHITSCISSWIWSLLARLPDRGELSSEEIGFIRELGKKAILVGTGLKENSDWDAGMREVEASLEDDWNEEGEVTAARPEEPEEHAQALDSATGVADENNLAEPSFNMSILESRTSATESMQFVPSDANDNSSTHQIENVGATPQMSPNDSPAALNAVKAKLLVRMDAEQPGFEVNVEPDVEELKWNTKATVDMIITVAGEIYGQRDLLEFRSLWKSTV